MHKTLHFLLKNQKKSSPDPTSAGEQTPGHSIPFLFSINSYSDDRIAYIKKIGA